MDVVGGYGNMTRGRMDGLGCVGCHGNVAACHMDGLDVIVTCSSVICVVLGAIAKCWLGGHRNMVGDYVDGIVCDRDAKWVGFEAIVTCLEVIGNG